MEECLVREVRTDPDSCDVFGIAFNDSGRTGSSPSDL